MMSEQGTISLDAVGRRRGHTAEVTLTARIPPGTHIESHEPPEPLLIPTVVEVEHFERATVDYPEPVSKEFGFSDVVLSVYEGTPRFVIRGEPAPGAKRVRGILRYQACVNGACLPPRVSAWEALLEERTERIRQAYK
jgi:hypothetical protein